MRYQHAALYVFWIGTAVTFFWALQGYSFLSGLSFLLTLLFTAQAFIVAKAENALPPELGRLICRTGFFSAVACTRNPGKGFENIELHLDAKRPNIVTLRIRTKAAFWNAKKRAEKHKKELSRIVGLIDATFSEQDAEVRFHDETDLKESVRKVLKIVSAIER
ncbi:MAG TPA: hypothetical protein VI874_05070 [Candidatus Norongarragalinales archaeon]|nr:hypothetical protein [Candidatus Norongarragalinales archaeon]